MKHILKEIFEGFCFILLLVIFYLAWIGFDDSDIIALKSAISINLF